MVTIHGTLVLRILNLSAWLTSRTRHICFWNGHETAYPSEYIAQRCYNTRLLTFHIIGQDTLGDVSIKHNKKLNNQKGRTNWKEKEDDKCSWWSSKRPESMSSGTKERVISSALRSDIEQYYHYFYNYRLIYFC